MISIKNLWKSYNNNPVLKGLTLEIQTASTTIILGRSGVGKSVLLKQIAGLETPDQGSIEIEGICSKKQSFQVGMLFQNSALFDSLTIEENIAFPLIHHHHINAKTVSEKVLQALSQVGLSGFERKFPTELSGGQKRRAALARLIVYKPKILLFDEPTTGLDPITSHQIIELIKETQVSLQATVVIVTHDLVLASSIGHYFALHEDGIITIQGEKGDFFSKKNAPVQEFLVHAHIGEADTL